MPSAVKKSCRVVLLLHEIYGINKHMETYASCYSELGFDVAIPDFLQTAEPFPYQKEKQAYQFFTEKVGFEKAVEFIKNYISILFEKYEEIHLVGFSIGATIAWLCSESEKVKSVTGFYGSRIRDYSSLIPKCPTLLIYGEGEESFDVRVMSSRLIGQNVKVVVLPGQHGFADPNSSTFCPDSCRKAWLEAREFLIAHIQIGNSVVE